MEQPAHGGDEVVLDAQRHLTPGQGALDDAGGHGEVGRGVAGEQVAEDAAGE